MGRKKAKTILAGERQGSREPVWEPLIQCVGKLTPWFMWMGDFELEDGTAMHAYKHSHTRRYFHLATDGRAFQYVCPDFFEPDDPSEYLQITRSAAIFEAFRHWPPAGEDLRDDFGDPAELIQLAFDYADRDELMPTPAEFQPDLRRDQSDESPQASERPDASML